MTCSHKVKKRRVIPGEGMLWRNDLVSDRRTRGRARRRAPKCDPPTKVTSKQPQEGQSETKPLPNHLECMRNVEETQRKDEKHLSEEKSVEKVVEMKAKHSEIKVDKKSNDRTVLTNATISAEPKHDISSTAVKELQQQQQQQKQQQQQQNQEETKNKNPSKQKQQKVNRKKLRSNKIDPETKMKEFPKNYEPNSRNLEIIVSSGGFPKKG